MAATQLFQNNQAVTRTSIYNMLLNYKGYGNPNGKYWFIGMEENWSIQDISDPLLGCGQDNVDYYSQKIVPFEFAKENFYNESRTQGQTFTKGIQKLLKLIEGENDYRNILENESFITNSRFAPFPTCKVICEIFDKKKNDYMNDDFHYKFEISQLWKNSRPQKTFCLSKTYTENFDLLFQNVIPEFNFKDYKVGDLFFKEFKYEDLLIYQILHPRAFSDDYLIKLYHKLK